MHSFELHLDLITVAKIRWHVNQKISNITNVCKTFSKRFSQKCFKKRAMSQLDLFGHVPRSFCFVMLWYFAGCSENNEQKKSFGGQLCTERNVRCINVSMQSIVEGYNELHVFQKFLQMKIHFMWRQTTFWWRIKKMNLLTDRSFYKRSL